MSILNRPSDGLPSVLLALRRAIIAYGPQPEEHLLALCAPPAVVGGRPDMARRTLTRWQQLGAFVTVDGKIRVCPELTAKAVGPDDLKGVRQALLRLVLAPANNPELGNSPISRTSDEDPSLASDFTRGAAWALSQDIYALSPKWPTVQDHLTRQGVVPAPFANDVRWNGFVDWAVFLGLAWSAHSYGLVLDPAFAVDAVLSNILESRHELDQAAFLTRLAMVVPVVDGGTYRQSVEATIRHPWRQTSPGELSSSLSAALLHLEAARRIRLEWRADAPQRMLLGRSGQHIRPFTHVVLA